MAPGSPEARAPHPSPPTPKHRRNRRKPSRVRHPPGSPPPTTPAAFKPSQAIMEAVNRDLIANLISNGKTNT